MPTDVEETLLESGHRGDYDDRPAYRRNDYLGWIAQAKSDAMRSRRVAQMLAELSAGGVYMSMPHAPSRKDRL